MSFRFCQVLAVERALHCTFLQKRPDLCHPEQFLPREEHGGHGKVHARLTTHSPSHRVRGENTQSGTHSLDRAWVFWNSSSGSVCSWFRFSRLQKRREEELETASEIQEIQRTLQKALDSESESPGFRS